MDISNRENREVLLASILMPASCATASMERSENVSDGKSDMNANRNSDESIVPSKEANNDEAVSSAELSEERDSTKRNDVPSDLPRSQNRTKRKSIGLHGVREAARKDSSLRFVNLLHHVNCELLEEAFFDLKKSAAVGVDGVSWHDYERNLEDNIVDLHGRIHRGGYRAKPSLRKRIPKPDGRQRLLGVASLEDKIVQKALLGNQKGDRQSKRGHCRMALTSCKSLL